MNTELTKFLDARGVDYTIENDRVVVDDDLFLGDITSIPEGFNPIVEGYLYLNSLTTIPEGFNPEVGREIILPDHLKHLINKAN